MKKKVTLDIHNDELVLGPLEGEVAEGMRSESVHVGHESRVGVVFDVISLNQVFYTVEWTTFSTFELYYIRLKEVHLVYGKGSNQN